MPVHPPIDARAAAILAGTLLLVLAGGHALAWSCSARVARAWTWTALVLGSGGVERLTTRAAPGVRMVALIVFGLLTMKVLVVVEERARGMAPLSFGAWLGFAGAWLGMRPLLFVAARAGPLPGAGVLLRRGATRVLQGAVLVGFARAAWVHTQSPGLVTVLLLPGLALLMLFGVCNLLAGAWRRRGVACDALFRAPPRAQSLSEFWSRRWNLAFSEMTVIAVYRPLVGRVGRGPAVMAGFALSGVLHELAFSVPVRAGFGLPLLYFLLQGGLVLLERRLARAGRPLRGWAGRAWAWFWLAAPLPLLFHRPFLAGVVWPLIGRAPGE